MTQYKQLNVRMDADLYQKAQDKCKEKFDIGLSALIKVFLASFVSQGGIGFYVGDDDICDMFHKWILRKRFERQRPGCFATQNPKLRDLYDLGNKKTSTYF